MYVNKPDSAVKKDGENLKYIKLVFVVVVVFLWWDASVRRENNKNKNVGYKVEYILKIIKNS